MDWDSHNSSFQLAHEGDEEKDLYAWPQQQQQQRARVRGYMRMGGTRPRAVTVLVWSRDGFCSRLARASAVRRVGRRVVLAFWRRVKWLSGRLRLRRGRRDLRVGTPSSRKSLEWPGKAAKVKPSFWSVDKERRWPVQGW